MNKKNEMREKKEILPWYKLWFNTKYYHILYEHRNDEEAKNFITNIFNFLNAEKKSKILDLACGKGRHSVFISKLGYNVTGLDLSENNILSAKKNENNNLHFFLADMRDVFKKNYFDIVLNLFTSFGYFDSMKENLKVIYAVKSELKKNGIFVIDYLNVLKVINNLPDNKSFTKKNIIFNIKKYIKNNKIIKKIDVYDNGQIFHFQENVQILYFSDFKEILEKNGFKIIKCFGDYNLKEFNAKSDRLIIVAKKSS